MMPKQVKEKAAILCSYFPAIMSQKIDACLITPTTEKNLSDFNPIIVLGSFMDSWKRGQVELQCQIDRREREIFNALELGKTVSRCN